MSGCGECCPTKGWRIHRRYVELSLSFFFLFLSLFYPPRRVSVFRALRCVCSTTNHDPFRCAVVSSAQLSFTFLLPVALRSCSSFVSCRVRRSVTAVFQFLAGCARTFFLCLKSVLTRRASLRLPSSLSFEPTLLHGAFRLDAVPT